MFDLFTKKGSRAWALTKLSGTESTVNWERLAKQMNYLYRHTLEYLCNDNFLIIHLNIDKFWYKGGTLMTDFTLPGVHKQV